MPMHLLFVVVGGTGHVLSTLAIAAELTSRGHQVTCVTTDDFAEGVRGTGSRFVPYKSVFADVALPEVLRHEDPETFSRMLFLEENLSMLRAAEEQFDADRPDLVVYDIFPIIAGRLLAARWQRPAVCLSGAFLSNEHYNMWQAMTEAQGHRPWAQNETFRVALQEILDQYGSPQTVADVFTEPEAFTVALYPRSWQLHGETFDDRFVFVGPCLLPGRLTGSWRPPHVGQPVLLVSLGSSFNHHPAFFRACAEAFAGTPWHVVMAIGDTTPQELGELPDNVECRPWVPFLEVLPHATAFLTQGTVGAVMEAMYYGVPLLIFSEFAAEARPFADRALELGLGHALPGSRLDGGEFRTVVEELLADEGVRERVARMREDVRGAGGSAAAADAIEARLRAVAG
jgi:dTDP-L-oleandrosyltransferase